MTTDELFNHFQEVQDFLACPTAAEELPLSLAAPEDVLNKFLIDIDIQVFFDFVAQEKGIDIDVPIIF